MLYYYTSPWELKQLWPGREPYPVLTWGRHGIGLEPSVFITKKVQFWQLSQGFFFSFLFSQLKLRDNKRLVPVTIIKQGKFVCLVVFFFYLILTLCKSNLTLK